MKASNAARAALTFGAAILPQNLDPNTEASIKNVARTLAYGTMDYYTGNLTNTPETIAVLPEPYYWWEAGAMWGAMLDYHHYTGDPSYLHVITEALLSQVGPNYDYMNPIHYGSTGNDDQAFWGFAVLSAAERNIPQPSSHTTPPWLTLAENVWSSMAPRWNSTSCGGGVAWQIFASSPHGLHYKNSVSNGGFFQISARLARATGNDTYLAWANTVWDWSENVGFISPNYNVYDGADSRDNCSEINRLTFTYSHGIYLYGAAVLANYTNGDPVWVDRVDKLLASAEKRFFSPFENATDIMYEQACETVESCNVDMKSFKAYLSRFMWATAKMLPAFEPTVRRLLTTSAVAAAQTCTGGKEGMTCGQKWYVGGHDGVKGLGQQLGALEVVQGLLAARAPAPLVAVEIKDMRPAETEMESAPQPLPSKRSEEEEEDKDDEDAAAGLSLNIAFVVAVAAWTAVVVDGGLGVLV